MRYEYFDLNQKMYSSHYFHFLTAEHSIKLDHISQQCEQLRKKNLAIKEVNDQLHKENSTLKQFSLTHQEDEGKITKYLKLKFKKFVKSLGSKVTRNFILICGP